jgi:hypothetical protein
MPSRVLFPRWLGTAFTAPPLTRLALPTANEQSPQANERAGATGSALQRERRASEETTYPHGLCHLLTVSHVRARPGSGVASSGSGVRHRPLDEPSLNRRMTRQKPHVTACRRHLCCCRKSRCLPSEGSRTDARCTRACHQAGPASHEVARSFRVLTGKR